MTNRPFRNSKLSGDDLVRFGRHQYRRNLGGTKLGVSASLAVRESAPNERITRIISSRAYNDVVRVYTPAVVASVPCYKLRKRECESVSTNKDVPSYGCSYSPPLNVGIATLASRPRMAGTDNTVAFSVPS